MPPVVFEPPSVGKVFIHTGVVDIHLHVAASYYGKHLESHDKNTNKL